MKKFMTIALVSGAALALAACNTVGGAGRDVQSAGKAIENTAQ